MIKNGGQTGIRTLETVSRLHTFQACAFDHSATCPRSAVFSARLKLLQGLQRLVSSIPIESFAAPQHKQSLNELDQNETRPNPTTGI